MAHQAKYVTQPGAPQAPGSGWMEHPQPTGDCPPGLEYLGLVDHIHIHQKKEIMEILTGVETCNRYEIMNGLGQRVYFAFEESDCCQRQCCLGARGFIIHIVDNFNREVMRINRPFKCCSGCYWCASPGSCCSTELTVEAPPGNVIGSVQQKASGCSYSFVVNDTDGTQVIDIDGPCLFACSCCADKIFQVKATNGGQHIGEIRKKWGGVLKEAFTDADNFGINFPMDLAIRTKATLIGATFLIDFMAFEDKQRR